MFTLAITEKGGTPVHREFDQAEITIGRIQGNDVILPKSNISKRHARILNNNGSFVVVDAKSTNGTYINGKRIDAPYNLSSGDKIYVGDFMLELAQAEASKRDDAPSKSPAFTASADDEHEPHDPGAGDTAEFSADLANEDDPLANLIADESSAQGILDRESNPEIFADSEWDGAKVRANWDGDWGDEKSNAALPAENSMARDAVHWKTDAKSDEGVFADLESVESDDDEWGIASASEAKPASEAEPSTAIFEDESVEPETKLPEARAADSDARPATQALSELLNKAKKSAPAAPVAPLPKKQATPSHQAPASTPQAVSADVIEEARTRLANDLGDTQDMTDRATYQQARDIMRNLVVELEIAGRIKTTGSPEGMFSYLLEQVALVSPLDVLLQDKAVTEIRVNGPHHVTVLRGGASEDSEFTFLNEESVQQAVGRLLERAAPAVSGDQPIIDVRLDNDLHLHVIAKPVAVHGPVVTLRRLNAAADTLSDLQGQGTLSAEMAEFLTLCIAGRKNILVTGASDSGKTTLLSALTNGMPKTHTVVTIEDPVELRLSLDKAVRLEAQPNVSAQDLINQALRLLPHRIVVGNCRGQEAFDMLCAFSTTCSGSMAALNAASPGDALVRLETLASLSHPAIAARTLRELIASSVDVVVHLMTFTDGVRRVVRITEVIGLDGDTLASRDIFTFKHRGFSEEGDVEGAFAATGVVPRFYQSFTAAGLQTDASIFQKND